MLQELIFVHRAQKFSVFYGMLSFITIKAKLNQYAPPPTLKPISLRHVLSVSTLHIS